MSWAEIKSAINSNLKKPLDKLIEEKATYLQSEAEVVDIVFDVSKLIGESYDVGSNFGICKFDDKIILLGCGTYKGIVLDITNPTFVKESEEIPHIPINTNYKYNTNLVIDDAIYIVGQSYFYRWKKGETVWTKLPNLPLASIQFCGLEYIKGHLFYIAKSGDGISIYKFTEKDNWQFVINHVMSGSSGSSVATYYCEENDRLYAVVNSTTSNRLITFYLSDDLTKINYLDQTFNCGNQSLNDEIKRGFCLGGYVYIKNTNSYMIRINMKTGDAVAVSEGNRYTSFLYLKDVIIGYSQYLEIFYLLNPYQRPSTYTKEVGKFLKTIKLFIPANTEIIYDKDKCFFYQEGADGNIEETDEGAMPKVTGTYFLSGDNLTYTLRKR